VVDLSPHCFSFYRLTRGALAVIERKACQIRQPPRQEGSPTLEDIGQATQFKDVESSICSFNPEAVSLYFVSVFMVNIVQQICKHFRKHFSSGRVVCDDFKTQPSMLEFSHLISLIKTMRTPIMFSFLHADLPPVFTLSLQL